MLIRLSAVNINENSSFEDISAVVQEFEKQGFDFLPAWTMDEPRVPDRVVLPSERKLDEYELYEQKVDVEILKAREFYEMIRRIHVDYRAKLFPNSFQGEEDIEACRIKYNSKTYYKTIFP